MALETACEEPVVIDALVVRNDVDGFGVRFVGEGDEVVEMLTPILRPVFSRHYRQWKHWFFGGDSRNG